MQQHWHYTWGKMSPVRIMENNVKSLWIHRLWKSKKARQRETRKVWDKNMDYMSSWAPQQSCCGLQLRSNYISLQALIIAYVITTMQSLCHIPYFLFYFYIITSSFGCGCNSGSGSMHEDSALISFPTPLELYYTYPIVYVSCNATEKKPTKTNNSWIPLGHPIPATAAWHYLLPSKRWE